VIKIRRSLADLLAGAPDPLAVTILQVAELACGQSDLYLVEEEGGLTYKASVCNKHDNLFYGVEGKQGWLRVPVLQELLKQLVVRWNETLREQLTTESLSCRRVSCYK
jgi:hypothetical protein